MNKPANYCRYINEIVQLNYADHWTHEVAPKLPYLETFVSGIRKWMAFWIIQISVGISRIFIATHFPHQVILGVLAGKTSITTN